MLIKQPLTGYTSLIPGRSNTRQKYRFKIQKLKKVTFLRHLQ